VAHRVRKSVQLGADRVVGQSDKEKRCGGVRNEKKLCVQPIGGRRRKGEVMATGNWQTIKKMEGGKKP